mgnify:CR=1 FL=1
MNKSLVLKNKFYLFVSLVFSFFVFLYLVFILINGERGIISYYKIKYQQNNLSSQITELNQDNDFFVDKINKLQPNTIDLDYLDELLREKTGFIDKNEIVILSNQ